MCVFIECDVFENVIIFLFRYYHAPTNISRMINMISNQVIAKVRQIVGDDVMHNIKVISTLSFLCIIQGIVPSGVSIR